MMFRYALSQCSEPHFLFFSSEDELTIERSEEIWYILHGDHAPVVESRWIRARGGTLCTSAHEPA